MIGRDSKGNGLFSEETKRVFSKPVDKCFVRRKEEEEEADTNPKLRFRLKKRRRVADAEGEQSI